MICSRCNLEKPKNLFNRSSRHASGFCTWCKPCESERKNKWLIENPTKAKEYANRHREKHKDTIYSKNYAREKIKHHEKLAKMAVARAIKRGDLVRPEACDKCSKICKPEGHHFDYTKRLDVMWLCKSCHAREHVRLRKVELVATWSEKK